MNNIPRQQLLKIVALGIVGLYLLDHFVIEPAFQGWTAQGQRIQALQEKVERGRQVMSRQAQIQQRWTQMLRANLSADVSTAENDAVNAIGRWAKESRISLNSIAPNLQWQIHDEGYETYECRVGATGDQASLGRFIYEMETDALPVNLEDCELAARDAQGSQLTLTARITFLRIKDSASKKQTK